MLRLYLALPVIALLASSPQAQDASHQKHEIVLRTVRSFILPRYEVLAEATKSQDQSWQQFCTSPSEGGFSSLQAAFYEAANAWSGVEFILYGPISIDFRFERMSHWPERRNAVGRSLNVLLSRTVERDDLKPERFSETSAAAQGLTALERLLFEKDSQSALLERSDTAQRRCAVGSAIASALARTSSTVLDEWKRPSGALIKLEAGESSADEALTRLVTDYVTLFEVLDDQKLGAVMGKEPDYTRPALAEGWRSGRSLQAITINLEAASDMEIGRAHV